MSRKANIPVIKSGTIVLGDRVGQDKYRCAVWRLHCQCGESFDVAAPRIKQGWYRCPECDPKPEDYRPKAILGAMPGTIQEIVERTGFTRDMVKHHLSKLRDEKDKHCYVGKWGRFKENNQPIPVFYVGNLPDIDPPEKKSQAIYSRRYRRNIRRAIEKAREGKPYKDQYASHVALALADDTAKRTRVNPQHWFSMLGL